jgi:WD40 repeat protein/tRNA A-37 threonylcarbamoyl transferase component Bud32
MAQENNCPQCGEEMPPDAPEGLCPKCLMKAVQHDDVNATLGDSHLIEGPGTKIGRYELLELVGEGGMGLVYLAEQKEPVKRRVALKIIKPGMDSAQVIARFEAERQALALLDHPNIAHVFDAGTTEAGRPYFVMEYVKGMSITRYCDERKLDVEQRLRLFREVCEGVHHAHQKGIIHRDLKPSNILVSIHGDRAVPKIIDFGIAKAITQPLTDKTFVTLQGQLLGTPEYMSPEQVDLAVQDIDTRSDIYSLGVVLYELLAGVLPFERESLEKIGFSELQRTLREQEPASPSIRLTNLGQQAKTIAASRGTQAIALARRLHRELEWIPLKAMRKDRCRRYKSASEMADDVRNYLNGNPLLAGPETAIYRVQKFVHKHAGSVATVVLVAAAIILGLIVSTVMYFRAEDARQKEVIARTEAEQATEKEAAARAEAVQAREKESIARTKAEQAEAATKQKAEELRRTLYVNTIQLADAKHREGNARQVRELLDSCPEDLRGWEWNRLSYTSDLSLRTLHASSSFEDFSAALSTDGKYIVSGGFGKTVKVWDTATGEQILTIPEAHGGDAVTCVAFSPDGKQIVSGDDLGEITLWDATSGNKIMQLAKTGPWLDFWSVAFSPDGRYVAAVTWDGIRIWNANNAKEVMTLSGHEVMFAVAFSPDGQRILSNSQEAIQIWDFSNGKEVMTLWKGYDLSYGWRPSCYSPDGKYIATGGRKEIKIWNAITGAEIMTIRGHAGPIVSIAFSPESERLSSCGFDGTIKVWDVATGENTRTLYGHQGPVSYVAFTPNGDQLVSGGCDGTIKVWDTTIDRETMKLIGRHHFVTSVAFSPDGNHILTGSFHGTAKVWSVRTLSEKMTLPLQEAVSSDAIRFEYSPDGKRIASISDGGTVKLWDAATGRMLMVLCRDQRRLDFRAQQRRALAFSPDGNYLAAGGKVWNAENGTEVTALHAAEEHAVCLRFSPDGKRIASVDLNGMLKIWDAGTAKELLAVRVDEEVIRQISPISFSPDGNQIVSAGSDGTVRIWDTNTGAETMTLRGHTNIVNAVNFSPDGKRIISGSRDGTARVYDATTGAELLTLQAGSSVATVAFSPDGKTVAAGTIDGMVLWESGMPVGGYEQRENGEAARKIVDELYERHGWYREVIDQVQQSATLGPAVRRLALQIAQSRKWEDREKLENELEREAWKVIVVPDRDVQAYRAVLEEAGKADALEPNDPPILTTLGAGQYRVGSYENALTTLTKVERILSDAGEEPDPWNLAFKAMTLHKLGRLEEAKAALEQLRELAEDWQVGEATEVAQALQALLAEAEKLIAGEK